MRTIHKYPLEFARDVQTGGLICYVKLPVGSVIRRCDWQESSGHVCLWVEVFGTIQSQTHVFRAFGTGKEIPEALPMADYLASIDARGEVVHIFGSSYESRTAG